MSPGTTVSSALAALWPALAVRPHLAHVRDIEQAGSGAGLCVLGQDAGGVLHRHLVAGERDQAGAQFPVQRVERRAFEGAGGFAQDGLQGRVATTQGLRRRDPLCPET
jgi:hypothetical protein